MDMGNLSCHVANSLDYQNVPLPSALLQLRVQCEKHLNKTTVTQVNFSIFPNPKWALFLSIFVADLNRVRILTNQDQHKTYLRENEAVTFQCLGEWNPPTVFYRRVFNTSSWIALEKCILNVDLVFSNSVFSVGAWWSKTCHS
jgi:hypothetical protein